MFAVEEAAEEDGSVADDYLRVGSRRQSDAVAFGHEFGAGDIVTSDWKDLDPTLRRGSKQLRRKEVGQGLKNLCRNCEAHGNRAYLAVAKCGNAKCLHTLRMLDKWQVKEAPPMAVMDRMGATPAHYAARFGNIDVLQWLVESGANLRAEAKCVEKPCS